MAASSLEQKLSRLEAKLKQENREARRRIDLNLDISPQRPRPIIVITLSPAPAPSQRAALQLPLANDGGSRSPSSESSPQHPTPPARPRHMLGLPSTLFTPRSMESIEIDQKLQEIMKQTGYLTIGGQRYQAEINDLENLGEMGSGTCGQVWKMRFRKTGHVIAVKQMRRSGNKEENKRILMDLDVVLKSHDCPYIVQCFGTFITNTDVFIAMELMGTCAEKLKKRMQGPIPERILGKMTVAIVKALYYLKEKHGVIHRDVKPSNILLDERGQIKLCDFGISGRLVDSKAKTRSAGCAAYMAVSRPHKAWLGAGLSLGVHPSLVPPCSPSALTPQTLPSLTMTYEPTCGAWASRWWSLPRDSFPIRTARRTLRSSPKSSRKSPHSCPATWAFQGTSSPSSKTALLKITGRDQSIISYLNTASSNAMRCSR
ncbi:dual specificity mitogen-activated protein kinase kinase 7 isoform X2 [Perognathus longimembris pacificus]|uniref:dual specificity mitogen-activated protein kinase kinase 7 isoform X2 n=1 Tax=Perognathus longimembris pacificus TaxID=214514 RepID=UPI002018E08F|nr:dual specificity mitogen-activated protein kinase kinase 7 isoform X2 [Perognathus longimembris pacificus]